MNKRTLAVILILLAVGLVVYWIADGTHITTVERVQHEVTDPLFGTTSQEWKDEFHIGLIPYLGPAVGLLLVLAGWLLWSAGRSTRSNAPLRA
jgi:predicted PurR-regulated permease PerM